MAGVRQVHAPLAFAGGLDDRSIRVDPSRLLEERGGLLLPDPDTHVIDDGHQQIDVLGAESPAEVTRGRRVRNRTRTQRIEVRRVVAA